MSAYASSLEITIYWVPGQCSRAGNETTDQMAAAATCLNTVDIATLPYMNMKPHIRQPFRNTSQTHWSEQTDKLHVIITHIEPCITDTRNRYTEDALARLRIGHTHVTHSHPLTWYLRRLCSRCGEALSVVSH